MANANYSLGKNVKTFTSLNNNNIKKRFNVWQQDYQTGTVVSSHLGRTRIPTLEEAIATAKEFQEFSDECEQGRFIYKVDVEIIVQDSQGDSLMEDGDIAYSLTVYPSLDDFCKSVEVW